jgi:hypothetical protein
MDLVTHVNALPGLFEPSLLILVVTYLFNAVALLTLLGGAYALLHRLLAAPESSQDETGAEKPSLVNHWSKSETVAYREPKYHEA